MTSYDDGYDLYIAAHRGEPLEQSECESCGGIGFDPASIRDEGPLRGCRSCDSRGWVWVCYPSPEARRIAGLQTGRDYPDRRK